MKSKGFLSQDFLVMAFGLVFAIASVGALYVYHIWPTAKEIEITTRIAVESNPEGLRVENRSLVTLLRNGEQMVCLMLMVWGLIIITHKFIKVRSEHVMSRLNFLNISSGERIIPEDALNYHKDVSGMVKRTPRLKFRVLPDAILAGLHRFDSTHSIQDAAGAVKERLELAYEQFESDLSIIRYVAWAIPSVGFIGTVRGIGEALAHAHEAINGDISGVTSSLGLAFNSTLIALFLSIGLMFFVHILQSKQENLLIDLEEYTSKKVIGKMKTPIREDSSVSYR